MSQERLAQRIRERTLRTGRESMRRSSGDGGSGAAPRPAPGDLFVLAATAPFAVEWAVIDTDPQDRLLVIAADINPLAGGCDLLLGPASASGCLTLRCGCAAWIDAAVFATAVRTGFLGPGDLRRARRKRAEIEAGRIVGSALERETESEPDYRARQRELQRARAELLASQGSGLPLAAATGSQLAQAANTASAEGLDDRMVRGLRSSWSYLDNPYRAAASVLLVLTLGLSAALVWQQRRVWSLSDESSGSQRDGAAVSESELPVLNLPFAFFPAVGALRGQEKTLRIPREASYLLLIFDMKPAYPTYRLEIGEQGSGTPVLSTGGLKVLGLSELSVAIPRRSVSEGNYWLRLSGLRGDRIELVAEHGLRVEID